MKITKLFFLSLVLLTSEYSYAKIIDNDFTSTPGAIPEVADIDNTHLNKWYTWNGASTTVTTEDGYGKLHPNADKPSNFVIKEVYTAGDYVVSFDFKKGSGASKDVFVNSKSGPDFMTIALNNNSNGGELADAYSGGQLSAYDVRFKIKANTISTSWESYSFDFNVPATFDGSQVYAAVSVGKMTPSGVFYLDNFTIVEKIKIAAHTTRSASSTIYPNPATDVIHIDAGLDTFSVFLVNSFGRTLVSSVLSSVNNQLKVSQIPEGFYLLNIRSGSEFSTHKVIIN